MIKQLLFAFSMVLSSLSLNAQWTVENLSVARGNIETVEYQNKIYFIGGINYDLPFEDWKLANNIIDIYDPLTGEFDTMSIPGSRSYSIAEVYNGKMYVTSEFINLFIFDFATEVWESQDLEFIYEDIYDMARVDNFLLFVTVNGQLSLYDIDSKTFTELDLPQSTSLTALTACSGKFIMAGGGQPYDNIDLVQIYDPFTDAWSSTNLSEAKANVKATCMDGFAYFAGGATDVSEYSAKVEIFDVQNESWSYGEIPFGREYLSINATENAVYIAGGNKVQANSENPTDVTVFTSPSDTQMVTLPLGRLEIGIFGFEDKVYFVGGNEKYKREFLNRIDIFDELTVGTKEVNNDIKSFSIYPNPTTEVLIISKEMAAFKNGNYSIISSNGFVVSKGIIQNEINVENLPSGNYIVVIQNESKNQIKRSSFVKM